MDAFIISLADATVPRGGDVTARSMSNMKKREPRLPRTCGGETDLTRSALRVEAKEAPCGKFASTPPHQACILSANYRPRGLRM